MKRIAVKVTSVKQLNKVAKKCLSEGLTHNGFYDDTIHIKDYHYSSKDRIEYKGYVYVLIYLNRNEKGVYGTHNHDGGINYKQLTAEMFLHKPSKRKTRIKKWKN